MKLKGRTAIVTGSTGEGMGRQTAWTLAREGANVVLNHGTYRRSAKEKAAAESARKECERLGGSAIVVAADTRKEEDVVRLVQAAKDEYGAVDIAVANAGGDWLETGLEHVSLESWKKVVDAEVDGAFLLAREVLPGMRKSGWGRLVFVGWDRVHVAKGPPFDYMAGKAAREALAFGLARSEMASGITSNVVAPGAIPYPTDAVSRQLVRHGKAWAQRTRSWNQDVAEAILWLCQEEARFVTGSRIAVHGAR